MQLVWQFYFKSSATTINTVCLYIKLLNIDKQQKPVYCPCKTKYNENHYRWNGWNKFLRINWLKEQCVSNNIIYETKKWSLCRLTFIKCPKT